MNNVRTWISPKLRKEMSVNEPDNNNGQSFKSFSYPLDVLLYPAFFDIG